MRQVQCWKDLGKHFKLASSGQYYSNDAVCNSDIDEQALRNGGSRLAGEHKEAVSIAATV